MPTRKSHMQEVGRAASHYQDPVGKCRLPHSKNTLMNYRPKGKTLRLKFFKERHGNESLLQSRGKRVRYVKKLLLTVTAKLLRAYSHPKTSYKQRKPISASHKEPNKSIFIWGGGFKTQWERIVMSQGPKGQCHKSRGIVKLPLSPPTGPSAWL